MHKQDQSHIAVAAKKNSEKARMQRRKLRAKRLNKKNEMTGALVYLVNLKILHLSKKTKKKQE